MIEILSGLKGVISTREGLKLNSGIDRAACEIVEGVRARGDAAVFEYTKRFDGAEIKSLSVSEAEIDEAFSNADPALIRVMEEAARNIRAYHEKQRREGFEMRDGGARIGQRVLPLQRVGVYVPGGTASYPSTVLMDVIPASVAGVKEIVMATPPDESGKVSPAILAAAKIAGATRIYKAGGAQAIAALAYGTESIPAVDKIVGPGNAYVQAAKRRVFGVVGIDMIAGPSEILIIADESADAKFVAADMLSQAEHDVLAASILVTTSRALAESVRAELDRQLALLPRREIAESSIRANGKIVLVPSIDEAVKLSNELAPEHLELCINDAFEWLDEIVNAGSVFIGNYSPEPLGDYFAGPNHTLPTSGTARFSSPLGVDDFIKRTSYIEYSKDALLKVHEQVERFAQAEGLSAHARALMLRFEEDV